MVYQGKEQGAQRNRDKVQDKRVSRVPGRNPSESQAADRVGLFDYRAFRAHHAHVLKGRKEQRGCDLCARGVAGLYVPVAEKAPAQDRVVSGHRSDEAGDAPLPRDRGADSDRSERHLEGGDADLEGGNWRFVRGRRTEGDGSAGY